MSEDKLIPLPQAAAWLGISLDEIKSLARRGIINVSQIPSGELFVSESELSTQQLSQRFVHLRGVEITVPDAAAKYEIPRTTIDGWIKKDYIKVIKSGYGMILDEATVAFCAHVYRKHKRENSRAPLFDHSMQPYKLKFPDVADYRHRRKNQKA